MLSNNSAGFCKPKKMPLAAKDDIQAMRCGEVVGKIIRDAVTAVTCKHIVGAKAGLYPNVLQHVVARQTVVGMFPESLNLAVIQALVTQRVHIHYCTTMALGPQSL